MQALLERDLELTALDAALEDLAAGGPPSLVVEGDPGMGKTRLLDELAARTRARDGIVLSGRAAEYETTLPFAPWVDALDPHADAALALGRLDVAELARVLPSLEATPGGETGVVDERHRLHTAMRKLLGVLAGDGLLLVVLDDLHWADPSSVDLLGALLRRPPPAQVLIALGYRPRQVAERLLADVAAAERARRAVILRLEPLSPEATATLAGGGDGRTLYEESGGNPFYVEQLVRAGRTRSREGSAWLPQEVPPAVSAALEEEVRALDPNARLVLQSAAIAGADFDPLIVAGSSGLPPDDVRRGLDALLDAGLIRPASSPTVFSIRHPLVRRAIYQSAGPAWRLEAHGRTVESLRARGVPAAGLAHHVALSATTGDEGAIALLTEAAAASRARAPATAADWLARALELLPPTERVRRLAMTIQLAEARVASGRLEQGREGLIDALALVPEDDLGQRIRLTVRCVGIEHLIGRLEDAHERLQQALQDLATASDDQQLAMMVALAVSAFHRLEIADAATWGRRALEAGERLGRPAHAAAGAGLVAMAEAFVMDTEAARRALERGGRLFDAATDEQLASCLAAAEWMGIANMYIERFEEAVAQADRGIAVARVTNQGERIPTLAVPSGFAATYLGRLADAAAVTESAVEGARLVDSPFSLAWVLMNAAVASWLGGDLVRARRQALEVVERLAALDDSMLSPNAHTLVGQIELDAGDHRFAARTLIEAGGGPDMPAIGGFWRVFVLESLARAEIAGGRTAEARAAAERAIAAARPLGLEMTLGIAQRAMALVLLEEGDAAGAEELALASAAAADAVGARIEAARARVIAGRAGVRAGRRAEAIALLRGAAAEFEDCGARREAELTRDVLHRLGDVRRVTPRGHGPGGLEALTGRETEIADLVWDRRTNREIAETLFLSPKTIETHLRNIFHKVGVSSRVELAREVERSKVRAQL